MVAEATRKAWLGCDAVPGNLPATYGDDRTLPNRRLCRASVVSPRTYFVNQFECSDAGMRAAGKPVRVPLAG